MLPTVVAPSVPPVGVAADEERREPCTLVVVAKYVRRCRCSLELHPSLRENLCPRSRCRKRFFGARLVESVTGIVDAASAITELMLKKMTSCSFQNHRGIERKIVRGHVVELLVGLAYLVGEACSAQRAKRAPPAGVR